ncbi:MAG: hypothetical protein GWP04_04865 [Gammaproteobacteria bacterium]|nr:hypothetical protein [Gammaproteobacteria bacterium]
MLACDTKVDKAEIVVEACLDRYRMLGIEAEAISWDRITLEDPSTNVTPVIKTERRLDWILTRDIPHRAHALVFERLVGEGWAVHALVPMELLGEAHRELRGTPIRLQGWWIGEGGVHFGRPEIP